MGNDTISFINRITQPSLPSINLPNLAPLTAQDADQACRLLLSGLALALLDNCQVEELKPGIYAYLATWQKVANNCFWEGKDGGNET